MVVLVVLVVAVAREYTSGPLSLAALVFSSGGGGALFTVCSASGRLFSSGGGGALFTV